MTPFAFSTTVPLSVPQSVVAVIAESEFVARWVFSGPVTLAGPPTPRAQIYSTYNEEWWFPDSAEQVSPTEITMTYPYQVSAGQDWRINDGDTGFSPQTPVIVPATDSIQEP